MEGSFFRSDAQPAHDDGFVVKQKPNPVSGPTAVKANDTVCFDCNICLDTAHDPVVTLCGHLFCWPCIYKWFHVQTSSVSSDQQQNCPVCKATISIGSLVPLYGRGMSSSTFAPKKQDPENMIIPRRPSPTALNNLTTSAPALNPNLQPPQSLQHSPRHNGGSFTTMETTDLANAVMTSFVNPVIGMFGDMVYTRIFGTFTNTLAHPSYRNPNSIGGNNHRMRRQEMQIEKSLNRVTIFLLCCILLCLLLF
ncbi:PREDICTED: E3 ubiquitin-protein ligase RMA3 [Tarenaya hassleriana]|uniref:E3 ubiquitin-protein ligase RMA3 n=1 Tax=Tarenaya hassleriana TaxID=28532 RepID=UPI00053C80A0|nr:PREDICTED: E3 ubiquitin-protein ligase RMA3 [Tarenaya hassleriana]